MFDYSFFQELNLYLNIAYNTIFLFSFIMLFVIYFKKRDFFYRMFQIGETLTGGYTKLLNCNNGGVGGNDSSDKLISTSSSMLARRLFSVINGGENSSSKEWDFLKKDEEDTTIKSNVYDCADENTKIEQKAKELVGILTNGEEKTKTTTTELEQQSEQKNVVENSHAKTKFDEEIGNMVKRVMENPNLISHVLNINNKRNKQKRF